MNIRGLIMVNFPWEHILVHNSAQKSKCSNYIYFTYLMSLEMPWTLPEETEPARMWKYFMAILQTDYLYICLCKFLSLHASKGEDIVISNDDEHVSPLRRTDVIWCDVIWYDVMWYDVMWYDMMWCDVIWCDMMWCDVIWCDMMWYDVMWCDMMWCDMMWCDVIWCDVKAYYAAPTSNYESW